MKIENQAVLFALLSKYAMLQCGDEGKEVIQEGMIKYSEERGRRMAANAAAHGDPITMWTNQTYSEWKPDYDGQMEFGYLEKEPALKSYISKCAWCDAWKKYNLLEYGKYYCVNVDKAVFRGFCKDFECIPKEPRMSFGGERCEFNWGLPLTPEDEKKMTARKIEIGSKYMKDFNFHTAHLYFTITSVIKRKLPDDADEIISKATEDYINIFGDKDYDALFNFSKNDF